MYYIARDFAVLGEFKDSANAAHISFPRLGNGHVDAAACREAQIQLRVIVEHPIQAKAVDNPLACCGSILLP
jgi:hypothetical protein